jgi:hypothetical protein
MKTPDDNEITVHDEVSLLLPWYVNGTLDGKQKELVDGHVHSCLVCRKAFAIERKTLDMFRNESPLDQSVQAGFERLLRSIAAGAPAPSGKSAAWDAGTTWHRVLDWVRSCTSERLRPALVAAPLAVIAILGITLFLSQEQQPVRGAYHTLSSPVAGVADPDDIHVIFARGTGSATIDALLNSLPAKIIDGPNGVGVYTVRLLGVASASERQAAILGLRSQPHVIFAEAAQPLSVSNEAGTRPQ